MTELSPSPSPPREFLPQACARHEAYLRARLRGLGVAESGLDDAVQDVFEVLVRRFGDYDPRFSLRQWLAGVARKVARRHRERSQRAPETIEESAVASTLLDPERWASQQEALAGLQEFLGQLDRDRWAVFVLSEIEGLRGTEIAAELGVNLSTVYARLRTAREAFERAMASRRRRDRSWLVLPWFGSSQFPAGKSAAFVTPIVLVGLLSASVGGILAVRGCGENGEESRQANVHTVPEAAAPSQSRPMAEAGGSAPVQTGLLARGVPAKQDDGWIGGGSGSSSRGEVSWSHRERYRMVGDELQVEIEYTGDPHVAVNFDVGWVELEQFELVEGPPSWLVALAAGETKVVSLRLRAKAPGVVRLGLQNGSKVGQAFSGSLYAFVLEEGVLRRCGEQECLHVADSIAESVTGETVKLTVRNDCSESIAVVMIPCELDAPPADAQSMQLRATEERVMTVDEALCFARRKADGTIGGRIGGSDDFIIHFLGEACDTTWAEGPNDARLGIPGPRL